MLSRLHKRKRLVASLSIIIVISSLLAGKTISASSPSIPSTVPVETVTVTFTETPTEEQNVYLVAKGMDGSVYYRSYDTVAEVWEEWKPVLDGSTVDTPAATVINDQLFMVVRGSDASSLWFGTVDLTDDSFSGWSFVSGSTDSTPTMSTYGSKLVLTVKGMDGSVYYRSYDTVAEVWEDWKPVLDGSTVDTPAATVIDDELFMVVRGSDATSLWFGTVDLTDDSFSGWSFVSTPRPTPTPTPDELKLVAYANPPSLSDSQPLDSINCNAFGSLSLGQRQTYTVYFRNEGVSAFTLFMSTSDWVFRDNVNNLLSASYEQYFAVTWNYDNSVIAPGEVRAINLTLAISSNIVDVSTFSFNVIVSATQ